MNYVKKALGIYIAFLLQSLIFEDIKIFSCSPDILLAVVIMLAVSSEFTEASALGAFAGLLSDVIYGRIFGMNILIYMYLALLVSLAVDQKNDNSPLIMGWVCFVCTAALEIVIALLKYMLGYSSSLGFLGANILVKGMFGAIFVFLYVLIRQHMIARKNRITPPAKEETV